MNYMADVAKMLGVEIGEEFNIEGGSKDAKYKFSKDYLIMEITDVGWTRASFYLADLLNGKLKIVKLPKPILTDKEKEDLSGIIRLFRDEVISICKFESMRHCGYEFLSIKINNNVFKYETTLPYFKKWAMYKGMKLEKEYSLEELGL